jgi:transcriptional regulator with XRE-family HTH domain
MNQRYILVTDKNNIGDYITVKTLSGLYKEVVVATNNFKQFNIEVLMDNPRRLVIFRLLMNLDQRSLASLLNKSQGTIWSIENGYIKNISAQNSLKILKNVRKIKTFPDEKELLGRLSGIKSRGRFYGEYAKEMSTRAAKDKSIRGAVMSVPTSQEDIIRKELINQNINFKFHGIIEAHRKFVVDFVFPSEKDPKLILEVKNLPSDYRKRILAIDLAYRALKIRQSYPNTKLIAVVDGKLQNDALDILNNEYDRVIQNTSLEETLKIIKSFI